MESSNIQTINENTTYNEVYTDKTLNSLSEGLLHFYKPVLQETQSKLQQIREKQTVIAEQLHDENVKIAKIQHSDDLQEMYNMIKKYNTKLQNIKKDMKSLHEKSTKLKKRALKLQQHREKEVHLKTQQKEVELQREQDLIAKHSTG